MNDQSCCDVYVPFSCFLSEYRVTCWNMDEGIDVVVSLMPPPPVDVVKEFLWDVAAVVCLKLASGGFRGLSV